MDVPDVGRGVAKHEGCVSTRAVNDWLFGRDAKILEQNIRNRLVVDKKVLEL